jgi:multiple sugar transport system substrate-binding protein
MRHDNVLHQGSARNETSAEGTIARVHFEHTPEPLGIGVARPRLSWTITTDCPAGYPAWYQAAMTDPLGMTTLPKGGEKSYAIQMSQYLGVNKDSQNKEAAALFVNFFVTSPEAGAVLETNRGVPSSPVVRQAISGQSSATDAVVYRIYDAVADRTIPQDPNLPNDQEFVNELELIGQQVAFGESTVDQAAADLQALIERLAVK